MHAETVNETRLPLVKVIVSVSVLHTAVAVIVVEGFAR